MNFNLNNGQYYKILIDDVVVSFGELVEGQILSTEHDVIFIEKDEYDILNIENYE